MPVDEMISLVAKVKRKMDQQQLIVAKKLSHGPHIHR
jgi:ubiquitin